MNPSSPPPIPTRSSGSFPRQAATFSLVAPFVSFAIGIFLQPQVRGIRIAMIILGLISMLLIVCGMIFGIVALLAMKSHGREGIFGKALAGTCINGILLLLILISLPAVMKAAERAKARQRQQMEQQQR
jgi:hypothetical protein